MWTRLALVVLASLGLAACTDDNSGDPGADAGVPDMETACQASTPHEELLLAPTTADVVPKVPTHPPVGDGGLP